MRLIIPANIERKLNAYVQSVDGEIAGMGEIEVRDDGNLWVTDIAIYDQVVTGGTADLSSEALASFQTELVKAGKSPKNWYLWWHSHSTMGAFFSATDTGTIESSTEFDHIVSLVVNKRRDRRCRLDTHHPFRISVENIAVHVPAVVDARILEIDRLIEDLELEKSSVEYSPLKNKEDMDAVKEEVETKVREKIHSPWKRPAGYGHQHQQKADRSYYNLPLDDNWSKKRKKDGTVTTPKEILDARNLDGDDLLVMIQTASDTIREFVANGNGDTPECQELRADRDIWLDMLEDLDAENYGLSDTSGQTYWNGTEYVPVPLKTEYYMDDDDDLGMPKLIMPPYATA